MNEKYYNQILMNLRKRTETASKLLLVNGGLNIYEYAFALTESILEALDSAMCYPNANVLKNLMEVMDFEKGKC